MQTDGFNKCIYHWLTTSELTAGLSLKIYKLLLKIHFHMQKMNDIFYFRNPTVAFYYMVLWNAWFSLVSCDIPRSVILWYWLLSIGGL